MIPNVGSRGLSGGSKGKYLISILFHSLEVSIMSRCIKMTILISPYVSLLSPSPMVIGVTKPFDM